MPSKRALICGCNYPGTEATLRGCVNDAHAIQDMLVTHFGFDKNEIIMLLDTEKGGGQPTGKEIKSNLKKLVQASKPGDVLVFHFSGHGTQVREKGQKMEEDGMDEAICPTDMNLICDDDLRILLKPLDKKVRFTMIADCCHSGSMLDHPKQQISGDKDPSAPDGVDKSDARELMSSFFKGENGADDAKNRSLPQDLFSKILGNKLGMNIDPSMVKTMLAKGFGDDASNKALSAAGMLQGHLDKMEAGGGAHAKKAGMVSKILGKCMGSSDGQQTSSGGGGGGGGNAAGQSSAAGGNEKTSATGVLVTGCQSHETSADACPSGNPRKAFGALSNALTTTVNAVKKKNPNAKMNNQFVVSEVRKTLLKAGFDQNPCLECRKNDVKEPFICD